LLNPGNGWMPPLLHTQECCRHYVTRSCAITKCSFPRYMQCRGGWRQTDITCPAGIWPRSGVAISSPKSGKRLVGISRLGSI